MSHSKSERKVVSFKAYPYFWELSKNKQKNFDFRLYDPTDERFQLLEKDWQVLSIELVNTETGEKFRRPIKGYISPGSSWGNWVCIFF